MTDTLNLQLGEGKLYFAPYAAGVRTLGERFLGNCTELSMTSAGNRLNHMSSTGGKRRVDQTTMLDVARTLKIVTDNFGLENVGLYAMGLVVKETISSTTGHTDTIVMQPGLRYQIGVTPANPEGARKINTVTVTKGVTALTINTDYTVDVALGTVTPVVGGAILANDSIAVGYGVSASTINRIAAGDDEAEGTLRWVSDNSEGDDLDYYFPHVRLGPDGDLKMISPDAWNTVNLLGTVLEDEGVPPYVATTRAA